MSLTRRIIQNVNVIYLFLGTHKKKYFIYKWIKWDKIPSGFF